MPEAVLFAESVVVSVAEGYPKIITRLYPTVLDEISSRGSIVIIEVDGSYTGRVTGSFTLPSLVAPTQVSLALYVNNVEVEKLHDSLVLDTLPVSFDSLSQPMSLAAGDSVQLRAVVSESNTIEFAPIRYMVSTN